VYYEKAVRLIGEINNIVECEIKDGVVHSERGDITSDEKYRIAGACARAGGENGWEISSGHKFFLCN